MKKLVFFIGIALSLCNLNAQQIVNKNYQTSKIDELHLNLQFAKTVELKSTSSNQIKIEAKVNINNNQKNDQFSLKEDKISSTLKIKSDYGNTFDNKKGITITGDEDCGNSKSYVNCNRVITEYIIYVPKNIDLRIKSITGNVKADNYTGNLKLDLVSGDITVKKHSKKMDLATVSGDIDVVVSDAEFKAQTLTGMVYSDLNIDFKKKEKGMGSNISGIVKNGNASLKMVTVSGDVFLRKK